MNSLPNKDFYFILLVCFAIVYTLRALPFLFFSRKEMPIWLQNLGQSLPSAVMACLIIYCIQSTDLAGGIVGWAPLIGVGATILVYYISHSMFLSMLIPTAIYMFLLTI